MSGRDFEDSFGRRLSPHTFEEGSWDSLDKLTVEEKRNLLKGLHKKISILQTKINDARKNKAAGLDELKLSQMVLMWIYDQIKYGKM